MSHDATLSPREQQVLELIAQGLQNKEVADRLCLSIKTVEAHRTSIMDKWNVHNAVEMVRMGLTRKVLTVEQLVYAEGG